MNDKAEFQHAGIQFLYDMELIHEPQLINNLKLNILTLSNSIKDVEFLMSYPQRSILIYLNLSWFGEKFLKNSVTSNTMEIVTKLLPNFRFRVTTDKLLFDLAVKKAKSAMEELNNEDFKD